MLAGPHQGISLLLAYSSQEFSAASCAAEDTLEEQCIRTEVFISSFGKIVFFLPRWPFKSCQLPSILYIHTPSPVASASGIDSRTVRVPGKHPLETQNRKQCPLWGCCLPSPAFLPIYITILNICPHCRGWERAARRPYLRTLLPSSDLIFGLRTCFLLLTISTYRRS